jgi:hypothetical protein
VLEDFEVIEYRLEEVSAAPLEEFYKGKKHG